MHGRVSFLTLSLLTWHGEAPSEPMQKELDQAQFMRYVESGEGATTVECENVVAEFERGRLFGEIALLDPDKATRLLSAMTRTDCILLIFN